MKNKSLFLIIFLFSILTFSYGQGDALEKGLNSITKESTKAQLEFLSSDWMEGRATGEKGQFLAADYLSSMLQFIGIEPAGDNERSRPTSEQRKKGMRSVEYKSYFQNIYLTRYLESIAKISIINDKNNHAIAFNENVDFSISDYSLSMHIKTPIVFVGYGFVNKKSDYNDFKNVDVKGKIILRLKGYPGHLDTNSAGYKKFHKDEQYFDYYMNKEKNKTALEKGAIGVIEIATKDDIKKWTKEKDFINVTKNETPQSPIYKYRFELPSEKIKDELIQINASGIMVHKILENHNINIEYFEKQIATNLIPQSQLIKGVKIDVDYDVTTDLVHTRNVLGVIEGENKNEIVVIGAHYDHLGAADGFIWNGTNDNASGTVGVWMLAKAFKSSGIKPKKTIVFAAWTGEEKGFLGSEYFTEHPYSDRIENIKLNLNFDMISKDSESDTLKNKVLMVYTSSYSELEEMTEKHIVDYDLNLDMRYYPSGGNSDHVSFSNKAVPIIYLIAGAPIELHTPKDDMFDINWDKMVDIIKLSYLNLWEIVNGE